MNKKKIVYWCTTVLVALILLMSGFAKLTGDEMIAANMQRMGFPKYMSIILGVWYLGAAITIVVPGLSRLKEWAYAGAFFALSGAFFSHIAMGDPAGQLAPVAIITALIIGSYFSRPDNRRLAS